MLLILLIKNKILEFAEDNRYHQAQKWNYRNPAIENQELSFEDELCQEMLNLGTVIMSFLNAVELQIKI